MRLDTGFALLSVLFAGFGNTIIGPDDDTYELSPAFDITEHKAAIEKRVMTAYDHHCSSLLPINDIDGRLIEVSSICATPVLLRVQCQWFDTNMILRQRWGFYYCGAGKICLPRPISPVPLARCLTTTGPNPNVLRWQAPRVGSSHARLGLGGADGSLRRILATNFYELAGEENRTEAVVYETDWISAPSGQSEGVDYNQTNPVSDPIYSNTTRAMNITVTPGGNPDLGDVTVYSYWMYA